MAKVCIVHFNIWEHVTCHLSLLSLFDAHACAYNNIYYILIKEIRKIIIYIILFLTKKSFLSRCIVYNRFLLFFPKQDSYLSISYLI